MKNKYYIIVLFLVLAIFLSGCSSGGIVGPATEEAKIKSVIYEYLLALNDQNWNKAKGYCVYQGDRYYAVEQMEDMFDTLYLYCNIVTINAYTDIQNVSIYGNAGQAYAYTGWVITGCGYYEGDEGYTTYYLQKIGNSWKLE